MNQPNMTHDNGKLPRKNRVLEKPIAHFSDPVELLCAFRDAVENHRDLWRRGYLASEITPSSIVIQGAHRGPKGELRPSTLLSAEQAHTVTGSTVTGNLQFIPISSCLRDHFGAAAIPGHDYRDDLETFYYILKWICATNFGHGISCPLPPSLSTFGKSPLETANLKYQSLQRDGPVLVIFDGPISDLLVSLREFCLDNYHYRFDDLCPGDIYVDQSEPAVDYPVVDRATAECDYRAYLALVEQAIDRERTAWPERRARLMAQLYVSLLKE